METELVKIPVTSLIIEFQRQAESSPRLSGSPHALQDLLFTVCQHPGRWQLSPQWQPHPECGLLTKPKLGFDTCRSQVSLTEVPDHHRQLLHCAGSITQPQQALSPSSSPSLQPELTLGSNFHRCFPSPEGRYLASLPLQQA